MRKNFKSATDAPPGETSTTRKWRTIGKRRGGLYALAGMSVVALALVAVPALASGGPVTYHACVSKTGSIRIVSKSARCPARQRKISWNSAGPTGPQGKQGPAGPRGHAGPNGITNGYVDTVAGPVALSTTGLTSVATLSLPTGNFLITATAQAAGNSALDTISCALRSGNGSLIDFQNATVGAGDEAISMSGSTAATGAQTLKCQATNSSSFIYSATISAVQVDHLTMTTG